MTTKRFWLMKGLGMGLLMIGAIALMGFVTMGLWNALMPQIFGLIEISIWQAYGLLLLSKLLFGRFGNGRSSGRKWSGNWKHRMKEKWQNMSEEEQTAFKQKMQGEWKKDGCRNKSEHRSNTKQEEQ